MSQRFELDKEDIKRVLKNALIFAGPALLVLLADTQKALPQTVNGTGLVVALYLLNLGTDLLRKFLAENKI